jgi:hypothetical protein
MATDCWSDSTDVDWTTSSIDGAGSRRRAFSDVRVFPLLLAPCRAKSLAGLSFVEAFQRFVVTDPEVAAMAVLALTLRPKFEGLLVRGSPDLEGGEWHVINEFSPVVHPDLEKRCPIGWLADESDPLPVVKAVEARNHRFTALMGVLRKGELHAEGLPVAHTQPVILPSIWAHKDFYIDGETGDVFEVNPDCDDPPRDFLTKRWKAVMLRPGVPAHGAPNHPLPRRKPKGDLVQAALTRAGIDLRQSNLSLNEVASQIARFLPNPPKSASEQLALAKLVGRLRNSCRNP